MADPGLHTRGQKKNWTLTQTALQRFLVWIDEGTGAGGEKFLELRRRLVAYFDRKNCLNADELADETLNRIARRLEEEGTIQTEAPPKYCYVVARFVFQEQLRERKRESLMAQEIERRSRIESDSTEAAEQRERQLNCLEQCTEKLSAVNREIITQYYLGKERAKIENRRSLANKLGITMNALSIRACRIRETLEICVTQCMDELK
jgi:DNA-directed RNA polymerase specialized sigma24 family protein